MKYKNLIITAFLVLIAIIAYLSYQLYKKNHPIQEQKPKVITKTIQKKDEPKITIHIDPNAAKTSRNTKQTSSHPKHNQPQQSNINPNLSSSLTDEERIKESAQKLQQDMQELFASILSSKEVQENIKEMQKQLKEGVKELQEQLQNLPQQMDNITKEMKKDPFFGEVLQQLNLALKNEFQDNGDRYQLSIPLPYGKNSHIDIKTVGAMLQIDITSQSQSPNTKRRSSISKSLAIPQDAQIDKLSTSYKDDVLIITIPKDLSKGAKAK